MAFSIPSCSHLYQWKRINEFYEQFFPKEKKKLTMIDGSQVLLAQ